ncbi:MAG TPA: bifunctional (p)ppGpp synthetase/guanosine-3',5'-bis(diphosphate) 3'-pyrophosphohydrolase [Candidatus Kapabacteria bacterium]|nr:bifunctional (p)ppGpp synthetase/guanosine-3',5'-bis(diphosphate) 3'-pyrophosphohydrolase [Candidatus Kapabacteria bacterium]
MASQQEHNESKLLTRVKTFVDKTVGVFTKQIPENHVVGTDPAIDLELLLKEARQHLMHVNEPLISKAFWFCHEIHKNDRRASGEPYYVHLLEVARIVVKELPLDDISVAAALLHDIIEDHEDYSVKDIHNEFGASIADIVDGVTKITDITKGREFSQAHTHSKLIISMANDFRVILIKLADRLHNLRTLQHLPEEKQKRIAYETLEFYAPLAHRFGLGSIKWELEDLSLKYMNRAKYDEIKLELNSTIKQRSEYITRFTDPIKEKLKANDIKYEISGRPKHIFSIFNKMEKQGKKFEELYDLFAIRIILDTNDKNECFFVYGIVSELYTPVPERFKDYISVPKRNGYQSLHTTVIGQDGKRVEVQIRTKKMHEVAEKGVAAHFQYKAETIGTNSLFFKDKELTEWADWIRDILNTPSDEAVGQLQESFKLNLYQDEIQVFTPKGELRSLPVGATPVDYAFDIHSAVGSKCIGAKVDGRIVPLDYKLRNGETVEIITSKNQTPSKNWDKFAVTHKAKSAIRKYLNEEKRRRTLEGKELWEKKSKKFGITINEDDLERIVKSLKFANKGEFYYSLGSGDASIDTVAEKIKVRLKPGSPIHQGDNQSAPITEETFDIILKTARGNASGVVLGGDSKGLSGIAYSFARCCNPVPGDEIWGVVSTGNAIKVHRRNCRTIEEISEKNPSRLLVLDWAELQSEDFVAAIRVTGDDRSGMLSDITTAIIGFNNTNIRGVNIHAFEALFEGVLTVLVKNTEHLQRLFDRIRKVKGVRTVERYEG